MHVDDLQFPAREQLGTRPVAAGAGQPGWHADGPFVCAGRAAGPPRHRFGDQFGAFQQGSGAGQFEAEGERVGYDAGQFAHLQPYRSHRRDVTGPRGGLCHLVDDGQRDGHLVHGSPSFRVLPQVGLH